MSRHDGGSPERSPPGQGWFCHHGGHERGPLDLDALREALRLLPRAEVLVWHPSLPEWVGLDDARVGGLLAPAPTRLAEPVGLSALLFSFRGRVGRARYFWASCLCSALYVLGVMAALAYTRAPVASDAGTLIRLALAPPLLWISSALNAKRLHDMGMSATHLLWVMPATLAGSAVQPHALSGPLAVMGGAVELWLLLRRGALGPNRYGRSPLGTMTTADGSVAAAPPRRASGALIALVALTIVGTLVAYGVRSPDFVRRSPSLCSDPGVLATLSDLVGKDPSWIIVGAYYGSFANMRITFRGVRTLDADSPVRGSTCAAMIHAAAIDRGESGISDRDLSDVEYTVQYVDGSSTEYVVKVVR